MVKAFYQPQIPSVTVCLSHSLFFLSVFPDDD